MDSENNRIKNSGNGNKIQMRQPGIHRKESKRILAIISAALLMLVIWGICVLAGSFMKVKKIEVLGSSPYTADEIVSVSGIRCGDNVSKIKKSICEKAILQKLSYISEVKIRSGLFGKITISVRSDKAAYYTLIAGEYYAMSDRFRILGKESNSAAYQSGKLIFISLPKIKTALLGDYLAYYDAESEFVQQLIKDIYDSGMFGEVSSIKAESRYDIEITYSKFTIIIGTYKDVASKLRLASQMSNDKVLETAESAILDVSDPAKATIRFK